MFSRQSMVHGLGPGRREAATAGSRPYRSALSGSHVEPAAAPCTTSQTASVASAAGIGGPDSSQVPLVVSGCAGRRCGQGSEVREQPAAGPVADAEPSGELVSGWPLAGRLVFDHPCRDLVQPGSADPADLAAAVRLVRLSGLPGGAGIRRVQPASHRPRGAGFKFRLASEVFLKSPWRGWMGIEPTWDGSAPPHGRF